MRTTLVLAEAVRELKRSDFKELFQEEISKQDDYVQDCTIDTDLEIMIPDIYVESIGERLSLYTRLDQSENDEELDLLHGEMVDRFGPMPKSVEDLFTTVKCRRIAIAFRSYALRPFSKTSTALGSFGALLRFF